MQLPACGTRHRGIPRRRLILPCDASICCWQSGLHPAPDSRTHVNTCCHFSALNTNPQLVAAQPAFVLVCQTIDGVQPHATTRLSHRSYRSPRLSIECVAARSLQLEQITIAPSMRERRTRKIINHEILDPPIGKQARSPAVYCPMGQCSEVVIGNKARGPAPDIRRVATLT